MLARLRNLPAYFRDKDTPWWRKLAVVAAVAYVISPVDAIPDWIPVLGWLDDIGVLTLTAAWLLRQLDGFVVARAQEQTL
ncbi:MAG: DUF1232 domain-containing protein [Bacteroidetes bacterium]|nr:DUF1232 domain-containing protein [Bacteroidota bacterium]